MNLTNKLKPRNFESFRTPRSALTLALIGRDLRAGAESVAAEFDIEFDLHERGEAFLESIGRSSPDLVLIDSDIINNPSKVCELVRSRNPLAKVLIVACYWSERELALQCCADFIVHRPVRKPEWNRAFVACGIPVRTSVIQLATA